ncbi:MAG TPA: hypothetical protein VMV33_17500 [Rhodocyclaceae bacterium]|nr:hypothetical protein [Rhodocyclaceae bacterium]
MAKRPNPAAPDPISPAPPPAMGDNSGTVSLDLLLNPEDIARSLTTLYADRQKRVTDLKAAYDRFLASYANGIPDDSTQSKAADFVRQLRTAEQDIDKLRTDVKAPVLAAQRQIDGFFKKNMVDVLEAARTKVAALMTAYATKQAAEARRVREEEARRQAEEAARQAAALEQEESPETLARAVEAEQAAIDAAAAARARPADLTRVRSDLGSTASLRMRRTWELDNLAALVRAVAAGDAPSNVLMPNTTILDAMAKDKNQADLPGLRFIETGSINVR